jgi:hypothetical protein
MDRATKPAPAVGALVGVRKLLGGAVALGRDQPRMTEVHSLLISRAYTESSELTAGLGEVHEFCVLAHC